MNEPRILFHWIICFIGLFPSHQTRCDGAAATSAGQEGSDNLALVTVTRVSLGTMGGQQGFDLSHLHNAMAWGGAPVGGYLDALYTFLLHGGAVPPHAHTT